MKAAGVVSILVFFALPLLFTMAKAGGRRETLLLVAVQIPFVVGAFYARRCFGDDSWIGVLAQVGVLLPLVMAIHARRRQSRVFETPPI